MEQRARREAEAAAEGEIETLASQLEEEKWRRREGQRLAAERRAVHERSGGHRDYPGLAKVGERKTLFNFTVESTGALKPEEIVKRVTDHG